MVFPKLPIEKIQRNAKFPRQSGIGLPAAIFVITLMAVIAVAVNQLLSQNAQTFEEELNFTRAFYAAESGIGFAMNTIFPPEEYSGYPGGVCEATERVYDFTVAGLNQCSATVSCNGVTTASGKTYATILSEGVCGDVGRTIRVGTSY